MATYLTRASYTADAFRGMMKNPEDRTGAAKTVFKAAGLKLSSIYFSPSTGEVICVAEGDGVQAAALDIAIMASGAFSAVNSIELISMGDLQKAMQSAAKVGAKYSPPNR
jgi:uncharacterized protein with GYD domain